MNSQLLQRVPFSTVKFLLRHNAKIILDDFGDCTDGVEPSLVEPLYDHVDLEVRDRNGLTAFHLAVRSGHLEGVQRLLRRGVDVNQRTADRLESTPLQLAVEFASFQCVELLLQHGADTDVQDAAHNSALLRAAAYFQYFSCIPYSHVSKIELLLEYGADVDDILLNSWMFETSMKLLKIMVRYMALRDQERARWRNDSMLPYSDRKLYTFYLHCQEETKRMHEYIIFRDLSVYQFLKRNPRDLMRYVRNSSFLNRLEDKKLQTSFPNYYGMLMQRYRVVCKQDKICKNAASSLEIVLGYMYNCNHLVTGKIISYLGNQDMWNLIYVTDVDDSR